MKWKLLNFSLKKRKKEKGTNPKLSGTQRQQCKQGLFRANQNNIYNLTREPERKRDQEINRYRFPTQMSTLLRSAGYHVSNDETLELKNRRQQL